MQILGLKGLMILLEDDLPGCLPIEENICPE